MVGAAVVFLLPRVVRRMGSRDVSLFVVAAAITACTVAESVAEESGLTAMVLMGLLVGNLSLTHREAIHQFEESVVVFLIAVVYVLLAAAVDVEALADLWPRGFLVVGVLAFVGRPLLVALATATSDLSWREPAFLGAVAPRGVVAASLASVVSTARAFVIATAQADRGLLAAQHARALGCRTIVARVNDPSNLALFRDLGRDRGGTTRGGDSGASEPCVGLAARR